MYLSHHQNICLVEDSYVIPYPCDNVDPLVTLKHSSTCIGKGAAPDNRIRTRPPSACFVYKKNQYVLVAIKLCAKSSHR